MTFRCHNCGHEAMHTGPCQKCKGVGTLEKECMVCREEIDFCVCQSGRIQSKGARSTDRKKKKAGIKAHGR